MTLKDEISKHGITAIDKEHLKCFIRDIKNEDLSLVLKILDDEKKKHLKKYKFHNIPNYYKNITYCEYACFEELNNVRQKIIEEMK